MITIICNYRTTFPKGKSKKLFYRCYKNFDRKFFEQTLIKNLSERELFIKSFKTTFQLNPLKICTFKAKICQIYQKLSHKQSFKKRHYDQVTRSKLLGRCYLEKTTTAFANYKNNVIFVSIFYVNVKHNTLTTLTLNFIIYSKRFRKQLDQNFGINVKLQTQLFHLKMTKYYRTTKLPLAISLISAVDTVRMGVPATPPFSRAK